MFFHVFPVLTVYVEVIDFLNKQLTDRELSFGLGAALGALILFDVICVPIARKYVLIGKKLSVR